MLFIILIIIVVVIILAITISSQQKKSNDALARLKNIDPEMNPAVTGTYVGQAIGVSQANNTVYIIKNAERIIEIPFSQLTGLDIELDPVTSGIYTPASLGYLIINYNGGEMRFGATNGDANQIRRALMPFICEKVNSHNRAIAKAAGNNTKMINVTMIGQSQPSITTREVKAYIDNDILRLEEIATTDNIKRSLFSASVPLSDIVAFEQIGNIHYATDVHGGGSSMTGAVVGGIIAGGAGAIIGSRQEVTSTTREIDDRATVLKFRTDTKISQILFNYDDYYLLSDLIK